MNKASSGSSSKLFGNLLKMFGNTRVNFGRILENLQKSWESGRISSKSRQNAVNSISISVIKRALRVRSKIWIDWILCSRGNKNDISNIKIMSSRHRVIFSMNYIAPNTHMSSSDKINWFFALHQRTKKKLRDRFNLNIQYLKIKYFINSPQEAFQNWLTIWMCNLWKLYKCNLCKLVKCFEVLERCETNLNV